MKLNDALMERRRPRRRFFFLPALLIVACASAPPRSDAFDRAKLRELDATIDITGSTIR